MLAGALPVVHAAAQAPAAPLRSLAARQYGQVLADPALASAAAAAQNDAIGIVSVASSSVGAGADGLALQSDVCSRLVVLLSVSLAAAVHVAASGRACMDLLQASRMASACKATVLTYRSLTPGRCDGNPCSVQGGH